MNPTGPALDCLLEFGSRPSACFNFQEGVRHFLLPGTGLVGYHLQAGWGRPVPMVFTNPLCADGDLPRLLGAFLEAHGGRAIFLGIDGAAARALGDLGFSVNEFGLEYTVPVAEHRVQGRGMRYLRQVRHHGARGVEVRELPAGQEPAAEVQRISSAWLGERSGSGRELRFLTRPPLFGEAWGVRKFYCFKEGRLVGFVFFEPYFRSGRCLGYCANILRCEPGLRPPGILDFAILEALGRFRAEGVPELALGVCPLHALARCPGEDRLLRFCGQALYRFGGSLYPFRDLARHKAHYQGRPAKVYCCRRGVGRLATLGLCLRATGVL